MKPKCALKCVIEHRWSGIYCLPLQSACKQINIFNEHGLSMHFMVEKNFSHKVSGHYSFCMHILYNPPLPNIGQIINLQKLKCEEIV